MTNSVDSMKIARAYATINEAVETTDQVVKRQTKGAVRRSVNRLLNQFEMHNLLKSCQAILSVNAWESANSVLVAEIEKVADRFGLSRDDVAHMFNSELVNRRSRLGREEQWELYKKSTDIDDLPESSNHVCEDEDDGVVDADDPSEVGLNAEPDFGEDDYELEKWQNNLRSVSDAFYAFLEKNDGAYTNRAGNKWVDTPYDKRDHYGFGGFYSSATNRYGIPGRSGRVRLSRSSFAGYSYDDPTALIMSLVREVRGHSSVEISRSADLRFLEVTVGHHDGTTSFLVGACRLGAEDGRGEYDIQSDPRCYIPLSDWLPDGAVTESKVCEAGEGQNTDQGDAGAIREMKLMSVSSFNELMELYNHIVDMQSKGILGDRPEIADMAGRLKETLKLLRRMAAFK